MSGVLNIGGCGCCDEDCACDYCDPDTSGGAGSQLQLILPGPWGPVVGGSCCDRFPVGTFVLNRRCQPAEPPDPDEPPSSFTKFGCFWRLEPDLSYGNTTWRIMVWIDQNAAGTAWRTRMAASMNTDPPDCTTTGGLYAATWGDLNFQPTRPGCGSWLNTAYPLLSAGNLPLGDCSSVAPSPSDALLTAL